MTQFSLQIAARLDQLAIIRRFIQETGQILNADPAALSDMVLAVNEAATNIMIHGYQGQPGTIELELRLQGDSLVACLRDEAPPFDPTACPAPDLTLPLDQRPLGKVGVYLTMQLMDEVIYCPISQGGNQLTLIKKGIILS